MLLEKIRNTKLYRKFYNYHLNFETGIISVATMYLILALTINYIDRT